MKRLMLVERQSQAVFGFHVHVAEHPADEYDSLEKSGMRVVDRLYKHKLLGPDTIVVHAVHIDGR
jgi:cytosine/adenosine deaminase-related metal-dependent hydrolase